MAILAMASVFAHTEGYAMGANDENTTVSNYLAPHCTHGLAFYGGNSGDRARLPSVGPQSEMWISAYVTSNDGNHSRWFDVHDDNGNEILRHNSSTQLLLWTQANTQGPTYYSLADGSASDGLPYRYDIRVAFSGGNISFDYYRNGVLQTSAVNVPVTGIGAPAVLRIGPSPQSNDRNYVSGVIVADEDTRGMIPVFQGPITADGAETGWTGTFANVDDMTADVAGDADFISSDIAGQISTFAFPDIPAALNTGHDVVAVGVTARARKSAAGLANIELAIRHGTTNGFSAAKALDQSVGVFQHIFDQNPATAAAWTVAEVNAAEIGVRSAS